MGQGYFLNSSFQGFFVVLARFLLRGNVLDLEGEIQPHQLGMRLIFSL